MKPKILITGRYKLKNNKQLFYLDKGWKKFFKSLNCSYKLFNNNIGSLKNYHCLIVSGGGDIFKISKNKLDKKRDKVEMKLIKKFIKFQKPIITVCRGFQLIASYTGNKIIKIPNHVRTTNNIKILKNNYIKFKNLKTNSYHNLGFKKLNHKFKILGKTNDNCIEIALYSKNVLCLMFHPERKNNDFKKIKTIIKKQIENKLCN